MSTITFEIHHADAAEIQGYLRKVAAIYSTQAKDAIDEKKEAYYRRQSARASELADLIGRRSDQKIHLKGEPKGVKGGGLPEGASTGDEPEASG